MEGFVYKSFRVRLSIKVVSIIFCRDSFSSISMRTAC